MNAGLYTNRHVIVEYMFLWDIMLVREWERVVGIKKGKSKIFPSNNLKSMLNDNLHC